MRGTVLVLDDDLDVRVRLHKAFSAQSYRVLEAVTAGEAVKLLKRYNVDAILLSYTLHGRSQEELIDRLDQEGLLHPFFVLHDATDQTLPSQACKIMRAGAVDCQHKPQTDAQATNLAAEVELVVHPRHVRRLWSWLPIALSVCLALGFIWQVGSLQRERNTGMNQLVLLRNLLDCCDQALVVLDQEGKVVIWSKGTEKLTGWSMEEAMDRNISFLIPDDKLAAHYKGFQSAMAAGPNDDRIYAIDCDVLTRDGHTLPVTIYARRVPNHIGVYGVAIINQRDTKILRYQQGGKHGG